jgi:hypothetical protein
MVDVGDDGDVAEIHVVSSNTGQWRERDLAGKPGPTFPDRARTWSLQTPQAPKKEARPKGPGTPYSLRRNIVRNRRKTMGCSADLSGSRGICLRKVIANRRLLRDIPACQVHSDSCGVL